MRQSMLDTDILSEFLRGNNKVDAMVDEHLKEYGYISLSIVTYYEILNGLLYKDAKKQMTSFEKFVKMMRKWNNHQPRLKFPFLLTVLYVFINLFIWRI